MSRTARGFTIIELLVVMTILSLILGLTVPAFRQWLQEDDLTQATHRIEALFQLARDSAMHGGAPVTVVIDSVSGRAWLDTPASDVDPDTLAPVKLDMLAGSHAALPTSSIAMDSSRVVNGEPLDLPPGIRLEVTRARALFTFAPSGAAFADSLTLRSSRGTRIITADPWTGDARVF